MFIIDVLFKHTTLLSPALWGPSHHPIWALDGAMDFSGKQTSLWSLPSSLFSSPQMQTPTGERKSLPRPQSHAGRSSWGGRSGSSQGSLRHFLSSQETSLASFSSLLATYSWFQLLVETSPQPRGRQTCTAFSSYSSKPLPLTFYPPPPGPWATWRKHKCDV